MCINHQKLRASRDTLIDLLRFEPPDESNTNSILGYTYPLSDLNITKEQLTVPERDEKADIPIECSQLDVLYQLHDVNNKSILSSDKSGNGGVIHITTPSIEEDIIYKIQARKKFHDGLVDNIYQTYLKQSAEIKVGLVKSLTAYIEVGEHQNATYFDLTDEHPRHQSARMTGFGKTVSVVVENGQKGVAYTLFTKTKTTKKIISIDPVRGKGKGKIISIESKALHEDIDILIKASKGSLSVDLENVVLPLKVRANADIESSITPTHIVDYNSSAVVKLDSSQASVSYRVLSIPINENLHQNSTINELDDVYNLLVAASNNPLEAIIPSPPLSFSENYKPVSDNLKGTGRNRNIPFSGITEDSLLIIQAEKAHQVDGKIITSRVILNKALIILIKPDPNVALRLGIVISEKASERVLRVSNGQASVFYHFRLSPNDDSEEISLPAYFHQWADNSSTAVNTVNIGSKPLRLEVDYVIADSEVPRIPHLNIEELSLGDILHIKARKSPTNVATDLTHTFPIPKPSKFQSQLIEVVQNTTTEIHILQSQPEVIYQLILDNEQVGTEKTGNNDVLEIQTGVIDENTLFIVRSIHQLEGGVVFELDQTIEAKIKVD